MIISECSAVLPSSAAACGATTGRAAQAAACCGTDLLGGHPSPACAQEATRLAAVLLLTRHALRCGGRRDLPGRRVGGPVIPRNAVPRHSAACRNAGPGSRLDTWKIGFPHAAAYGGPATWWPGRAGRGRHPHRLLRRMAQRHGRGHAAERHRRDRNRERPGSRAKPPAPSSPPAPSGKEKHVGDSAEEPARTAAPRGGGASTSQTTSTTPGPHRTDPDRLRGSTACAPPPWAATAPRSA